MSALAGSMRPLPALAMVVALGLGPAQALPLDLPAPLQCVAVAPLVLDCIVDDAAVGDVVEFTKVGRVPVDVYSSVHGRVGACDPDTFLCGRYTVASEGEVLWARARAGPVVVLGHDPLAGRALF